MNSHFNKPILVYDGDCDFCRYWISRWRHVTKDRIMYEPYQEVYTRFPEIPLAAFQTSVKLILEDRHVYSGVEAILRALNNKSLLWCYDNLPGFSHISEAAYRLVAKHRAFFSKVTQCFRNSH